MKFNVEIIKMLFNIFSRRLHGQEPTGVLADEGFDERNPAVKKMVAMSKEGTKKSGRHSGLCGQVPSDYPEFAKFLVREGLYSLSINPHSVIKISLKTRDGQVDREMNYVIGLKTLWIS